MTKAHQKERVLLIGGNGYIGSHTALALETQGHDIGILDNMSSSDTAYLEKLTGALTKKPYVKMGDSREYQDILDALQTFKPTAVVHFAGYKSVPASVQNPIAYYEHNILSLTTMLRAMEETGVNRVIFSSSAAVYGTPKTLPIPETHNLNPSNPYGHTKAMGEQIIQDYINAKGGTGLALRYFNPVGADTQGRIGENSDTAGNVAPIIAKALLTNIPFTLTGDDFNTKDGSGERDFIHIEDLAMAHVKAVEFSRHHTGFETLNIGTGTPYSVLDLVKQFERASNRKAQIKTVDRRPGDIDQCWANPDKANELLGWHASRGLYEMCKDHWNWILRKQDQ